MIGIDLSVRSIDISKALEKAGTLEKQVTSLVTLAVREDTKPYVPYLNGDLRATAETESDPEKGRLVYGNADVPYARRQYYGLPNKRWPGTVMQWFDISKAANLSKWIRVAKKAGGDVANGR